VKPQLRLTVTVLYLFYINLPCPIVHHFIPHPKRDLSPALDSAADFPIENQRDSDNEDPLAFDGCHDFIQSEEVQNLEDCNSGADFSAVEREGPEGSNIKSPRLMSKAPQGTWDAGDSEWRGKKERTRSFDDENGCDDEVGDYLNVTFEQRARSWRSTNDLKLTSKVRPEVETIFLSAATLVSADYGFTCPPRFMSGVCCCTLGRTKIRISQPCAVRLS
jgi:hypothetical protein